jgi:hypothetical protein
MALAGRLTRSLLGFLASADALGEGLEDLGVFGEATDRVLGEDQLAVRFHVEDPVLALRQRRRDAVLLLDRIRQTGGLRVVVSNRAVDDLDRRLAGGLGHGSRPLCKRT